MISFGEWPSSRTFRGPLNWQDQASVHPKWKTSLHRWASQQSTRSQRVQNLSSVSINWRQDRSTMVKKHPPFGWSSSSRSGKGFFFFASIVETRPNRSNQPSTVVLVGGWWVERSSMDTSTVLFAWLRAEWCHVSHKRVLYGQRPFGFLDVSGRSQVCAALRALQSDLLIVQSLHQKQCKSHTQGIQKAEGLTSQSLNKQKDCDWSLPLTTCITESILITLSKSRRDDCCFSNL